MRGPLPFLLATLFLDAMGIGIVYPVMPALIGEVRGVGLIAAVELVADKKTKAKFDPVGKVALYLFERAQEHGLIVRAIQDYIAFCPPLIVTPEQIDEILARFGAALNETEAWVAAGMPAV